MMSTPPYNPTQSMQPKPEGATTILVLGILGLCCGILGIVAWIQGNSYMAKCRAMGVQPEGTAVAGRILGIITTVLMIIGIIAQVVLLLVGGGAAVMNAPQPGVPPGGMLILF
jgi:hypothetical protein